MASSSCMNTERGAVCLWLCPLQGGSSLDLSPSDSCGSGGTYMWDEEGLEPLGGTARTLSSNTTHHMGSFDSDLNSIVSKQTSAGSGGQLIQKQVRHTELAFNILCPAAPSQTSRWRRSVTPESPNCCLHPTVSEFVL